MVNLDIENPESLCAWLRGAGLIGMEEAPAARPLAGGVSNRTVWVERASGEAWVLKQALERLRVAVPWFCSPERIHREALGMRWLARLAPAGTIPELLFEDRSHHLLGMRAVPLPHENWKTMLLQGRIDSALVCQFGKLLGSVHGRSMRLEDPLRSAFADVSFFEALRLQPFYEYPQESHPEARAFLQDLIEQTRATRLALVHGDYSPKNILIHRDQMVLLDHEVIHWGDPMFDIGFAVAHLLSKAHRDLANRRSFAAAVLQFWADYRSATFPALASQAHESRAIRHGIACLLARAAGKSPVEYLDELRRARQRDVCLNLISATPSNFQTFVDRFLHGIAVRESA